jgi:hypothetical protein
MDLTPLTMVVDGHGVLFSACDLHYFKRGIHIKKWAGRTSYVCSGVGSIGIHRIILGLSKGDDLQVDHINRNGLDNRRENLRVCTHQQNQMNRPSRGGSSSYKGVDWRTSHNKWRASIKLNQKKKFLGHFQTELEAAQAYDAAAIILHGEFALLNFPRASLSI